jgi:glycosyltransferase involved in cell wall biosynthesis
MDERAPLVSIGMPAYNSAATLRYAVDSLLAQTFVDFELVISDNASTDATWSIIADYMQRDARVRGIRQPDNIGANANYSAVFRAARGKYFKWASSNDWCAPTLLQRCVDVLDSEPGTVLAAPGTRLFEKDIAEFVDYPDKVACTQDDPVERFAHVDTHLALNNTINGLVRAEALRRTSLVEHYPGADVVLVGHLALLGRIKLLPEPLFYRRMDEATATRMMNARALHRHHYPVSTWRSVLPAWRLAWGWTRAAFSAHLSHTDKARALLWVVRRTYWKRAQLGRDLLDVLRYKHH